MLSLNDIWAHYGTVAAVKGISIAVDQGAIITLIGANGAGKTTTLRVISGLHGLGRTVVRVDQNARLALRLAQRDYVMETGAIALQGQATDLYENPEVRRIYLGMSNSAA